MLAALLTPPGRGAIAVIHVCGDGAASLVGSLFRGPIGDHPRAGRLRRGDEPIDEVMVRRTNGFTGEETVEITCHGGHATVERVLASLGVPRVGASVLLER